MSFFLKGELSLGVEKAFGYPKWAIAQYLVIARQYDDMIQVQKDKGRADKRGRIKLWGYSRDRYLAMQKLMLEYGFKRLYELSWKNKESYHNLERLAEDIASLYQIDAQADWQELHRLTSEP